MKVWRVTLSYKRDDKSGYRATASWLFLGVSATEAIKKAEAWVAKLEGNKPEVHGVNLIGDLIED